MNNNTETIADIDIQESIVDIIKYIGENPFRAGLAKTPERVQKAWKEMTKGYQQDPMEILQSALFDEGHQQMVSVRDIDVFSICEHHLLPFFGKVHIAYIPNGRVVGLSKIPRVVDALSKRLQLQEKLTKQIGECLMEGIGASGVAVYMECRHMCMMMRGVQKASSLTNTTYFVGAFEEEKRKNEFYRSISINSKDI